MDSTEPDGTLLVPTDKDANADVTVSSVVAGMIAGADRIDSIAILRHVGVRLRRGVN